MQASRSTITDAHSSRREKKNAPHTPLRRKDYIYLSFYWQGEKN
nr:MAG TPA: hypothetical protein [Caudoviricetes sp.]